MKPADFGRLLASSSARGVIQNRELAPFAEVFSSTTTAGTFSMKAQGAMAWEMVRYALGWNRARRYVDNFVVLSEVSACMLVVAIMCMPFCATLSKSTLFCGDVICVAARAPTYVQARRYFA